MVAMGHGAVDEVGDVGEGWTEDKMAEHSCGVRRLVMRSAKGEEEGVFGKESVVAVVLGGLEKRRSFRD